MVSMGQSLYKRLIAATASVEIAHFFGLTKLQHQTTEVQVSDTTKAEKRVYAGNKKTQ
jgi:hypothetical protein